MSIFSSLDILLVLYVFWLVYKSPQKGFGKGFDSLISSLLLLAMVLGIFLLTSLFGLIKTTLQQLIHDWGFFIWLASLSATIFVLWTMRKKIKAISETSFSASQERYGSMGLALVRGLVHVSIIVIMINGLPFGLFQQSISDSYLASSLNKAVKHYKPEPTPNPTLVPKPKPTSEPEELIIGY